MSPLCRFSACYSFIFFVITTATWSNLFDCPILTLQSVCTGYVCVFPRVSLISDCYVSICCHVLHEQHIVWRGYGGRICNCWSNIKLLGYFQVVVFCPIRRHLGLVSFTGSIVSLLDTPSIMRWHATRQWWLLFSSVDGEALNSVPFLAICICFSFTTHWLTGPRPKATWLCDPSSQSRPVNGQ